MPNRRDLYRYGTFLLGSLIGLVVAVPGVAYILDPLRRKSAAGALHPLSRLSQLPVGEPKSFPIAEERLDAWVQYPREPIGLVWLVRQPEGSKEPVLAFQAECPHLGCAVNLTTDRKSFRCPCHDSAFNFQGVPQNAIPPRPMDRLVVELSKETDPEVRVRFERFRAQSEEKIPLA